MDMCTIALQRGRARNIWREKSLIEGSGIMRKKRISRQKKARKGSKKKAKKGSEKQVGSEKEAGRRWIWTPNITTRTAVGGSSLTYRESSRLNLFVCTPAVQNANFYNRSNGEGMAQSTGGDDWWLDRGFIGEDSLSGSKNSS